MYSIYVNGNHHADAQDTKFNLSGLAPGEHLIEVVQKATGLRNSTYITIPNKEVKVIKEAFEKLKEAPVEVTVEDLEPFKRKAGWYQFEDGHKVRGEAKALEYLKSL